MSISISEITERRRTAERRRRLKALRGSPTRRVSIDEKPDPRDEPTVLRLVASCGSEEVGHLTATECPESWYLSQIYVEPTHRGRHIATALMRIFLARVGPNVDVDADPNPLVVKLNERFGFVAVGTQDKNGLVPQRRKAMGT
jgi:GNAT superfamily N-acetyltransferase